MQTILNTADEYSDQVAKLGRHMFAELHSHGMKLDKAQVSNKLRAQLPDLITTAAGTVTSIVSDGILVLFFVIFLLSGRDPHQRQTGIYAEIESAIREYIVTKTAISAVAGVLVGTILWFLGLKMAALFGLLAFLFNFIPNVGPIVASLLPIPIAFAQFEDRLWMVLLVVGLPGCVHMTIGNFVEPRLMGRGLELHPVAVLLALALLGLLWGVVGMVLAVPIAAMVRIVLSRFTTTRIWASYSPADCREPSRWRPCFRACAGTVWRRPCSHWAQCGARVCRTGHRSSRARLGRSRVLIRAISLSLADFYRVALACCAAASSPG